MDDDSAPLSPVMKAQEVAAYLKVHVGTIYRLVNKGLIPHFRLGGRSDLRFNKEHIDEWVANREAEEFGK